MADLGFYNLYGNNDGPSSYNPGDFWYQYQERFGPGTIEGGMKYVVDADGNVRSVGVDGNDPMFSQKVYDYFVANGIPMGQWGKNDGRPFFYETDAAKAFMTSRAGQEFLQEQFPDYWKKIYGTLNGVTGSSSFGSGNFSGSSSYGNLTAGGGSSNGGFSTSPFNGYTGSAAASARQSAWSILQAEFSRYGLGDLVDSLKNIIIDGASEAEMVLRLRQTDAYKQRFAANDARIQKGLRALSEAEYIELEDQYSRLMRAYGLPDWYTQTGKYGRQTNLENFIANDVSAAELEDRIQLAVNRVQNGPKEVMETLEKFYPNITQGELLAYVLDPKKALPVLQRQIQSAEIGGEATRYGLQSQLNRAEELAGMGITQQQARSAYQTIGSGLDRGRQLSELYGETPYTQDTAEREVFGLEGATEATRKRRKIAGLESATFGGSTGVRGGALDANRAGGF